MVFPDSVEPAMAGADRVFTLLDADVEGDEGYVELVNAKVDAAGHIQEVPETTSMWAWKHPHEDGTVTYHKLEGGMTFSDVTFGYTTTRWSCMISICLQNLGKRLPSSLQLNLGKPLLLT